MNKLNKFLLKIFLLPKGFYEKMGCNIKQLEAILVLKLMMDDRRPNAFNQMRKHQPKKKKEISNATIWGMLGSLLMGLFFLMFFISENEVTNLTIFFTSFCTLLSLTLITDFTNVLLDVRDNFIILPKPINDKTFVLAKLLHIIIHVSKLVLPLSIPTLIFIGVTQSFGGFLILLPLLILAVLFTVFFINAFYIFVLKVTTPEKFKNIISYIQIAFAIGIYAASQILPRMIGRFGGNLDLSKYKWIKIFPTYWFANSWNALHTLSFSSSNIIYLALTLVVPIASIYVVIKYFAPSFNQKLSQISSSSTEGGNLKVNNENATKKQYSAWWANVLTKQGVEKMGFTFTWKMMMRSRDFKMKVYPGIGYMIVIMVIMFMQKRDMNFTKMSNEIAAQSSSGKLMILLIIYFSSLMIITALGGIVMSDKYKAAWIYFVTPIYKPGKIILGAIKSVIVMFFLPFAILSLGLGLGFVGISVLPNIILAICNQLLIITLMAMVSVNYLPFSTSVYKPNFSSVLKNILMMMLGFLVGIMHYFIYQYTWLVVVITIISLVSTYFLFKTIGNYSWQKILSEYRED